MPIKECLTCSEGKTLADKMDNSCKKNHRSGNLIGNGRRQKENRALFFLFCFSASPGELLRAGSRSLSDSVLSSLRSQGSAPSPGCHPHLCCSWFFAALCWEVSFTLSASLSDVHSLAGYGQLSPSRPEATLLAICLTSAAQKEQNYHFTPQSLHLQSIPCVSLCL